MDFDSLQWNHVRTTGIPTYIPDGLYLKTFSGAAMVNSKGDRVNEESGRCRIYRGGGTDLGFAWATELLWSSDKNDKVGEKYEGTHHIGPILVYWAKPD